MLPLLAALSAAAASFLATPLLVRWARSRELYCFPGSRTVHTRPVPRLGGIAILCGSVVGLAVAFVLDPAGMLPDGAHGPSARALAGLGVGGLIVFGVGLLDDLRGLRPLPKLLAQIAAALIAYWFGFHIDTLSWGTAGLSLGWLSLPVTLLWIVAVTNAYNLVDGIDGLATGMGLVAFAAILAAAATLGHGDVVVVAAVLLGVLLGFLPHNFNPARIFLGDSGSLFVGFVLAVVSVQGAMKSATAVLVAVPLFALAIPLLDTVVTVARRWLRGRPISQADARHIHHRLLARGLSHRDAVLLLYVAAAGFAALGILVAFAPPGGVAAIAAVGGLLSAIVLVLGMRGLGYEEFTLTGKVLASGPRRVRDIVRDRIRATDLAAVISVARSIEEIQAVLTDAAPDFGLLHMEVCWDGETALPEAVAGEVHATMWKLDYPIASPGSRWGPLVLRMRASTNAASRLTGAERLAQVLGPAAAERLEALGGLSKRAFRTVDGARALPQTRAPAITA